MATITIDAVEYTTYADVEEADEYAAGSTHGATWRDADSDDKERALITATRIFDRQRWATLYNTFALRETVDDIVNGSIELAMALLEGWEGQFNLTGEERLSSISAGSVSITTRRGISGTELRFPLPVQELIGPYLTESLAALRPKVTGVDEETIFPIDLGFTTGI